MLWFFPLAFAWSWAWWAAAGAVGISSDLFGLLVHLGTLSPALAALALTALADGRAGALRLLSRLLKWEVAGRWYLFAVTYMASVKLVAAVIHRVGAGTWPAFAFAGLPLMLLAVGFAMAASLAGLQISFHANVAASAAIVLVAAAMFLVTLGLVTWTRRPSGVA